MQNRTNLNVMKQDDAAGLMSVDTLLPVWTPTESIPNDVQETNTKRNASISGKKPHRIGTATSSGTAFAMMK